MQSTKSPPEGAQLKHKAQNKLQYEFTRAQCVKTNEFKCT